VARTPRIPRLTVTDGEVRAALRLRYPAGTFALMEEVGNGTGFACNRHADAVAVGLWPSRGLFVEGIEIKVHRGDWLKELAQPEKADDIAKWCDFWWVAAGTDEIVREGELPPNWGLLVLKGDKLYCKKQAPKLAPQPLDRTFVAAMFRRVHEAQTAVAAHARSQGFDDGVTRGPEQHQREVDRLKTDIELTKNRISHFEEASGLEIDHYHGGSIGKAVKAFMKLRGFHHPEADEIVARAAEDLERGAKQLRDYEVRIKAERELVAKLPEQEAANG
jgi:hypothetical protein